LPSSVPFLGAVSYVVLQTSFGFSKGASRTKTCCTCLKL
jgi:hypothetical protein